MRTHAPPGMPISSYTDRLRSSIPDLKVLSKSGVNPAVSCRYYVVASASATPHVKGAWFEVFTTTEASDFISLSLGATGVNAVDTSTLMDIGIGPSGSEVIVVPDLGIGWSGGGASWELPLRLQAGVRVAVRLQSAVASKSVTAVFTCLKNSSGVRGPSRLVNLNANLANSRGVTLVAPSTVNTKSSVWSELVAATPEPFCGLVLCVQGAADISQASTNTLIDLATGPAGSEVIRVPDISYNINSNESFLSWTPTAIPVELPAGSRITGRWAMGTLGSSMDMILLGIPYS